jgi:hypothetical protein
LIPPHTDKHFGDGTHPLRLISVRPRSQFVKGSVGLPSPIKGVSSANLGNLGDNRKESPSSTHEGAGKD